MRYFHIQEFHNSPRSWPEFVGAGHLTPDGMLLIVSDDVVSTVQAQGRCLPKENVSIPATAPVFFSSTRNPQTMSIRQLPEAVRLERLSICTVCEHNHNGHCLKCQTCLGRKIDFKVQATTEFCPLTPPRWGPWLQKR
jgi:hypothetical protein